MAKAFKMLVLLLAISLATITAQAQGPASAPESAPAPAVPGQDCNIALLNLSSCLTYVEEGSNLTVPEKGCCPGLSGLVNDNPICLCQLLASGDALGIKINRTKALKLPKSCKVDAPPVSLCSAVGIPVASPIEVSPAPATGGPQEPGSNPSTVTSGPTASSPASTNTGNPSTRGATSMATMITIGTLIYVIVSPIF